MRAMGVAILAAGCGFDPGMSTPGDGGPTPDADGDPSDGSDSDAAPLGPWGTPMPITELNVAGIIDDDPTLTADELEIWFATRRLDGPVAGGEDIWHARRASKFDAWTEIAPVVELNSASLDSNVDVSADGTMIVFTSQRGGATDLWWSSRPDRASLWGKPTLAADLSSGFADWGAFLSQDKLSVVLCSQRNGSDEELYGATRATVSDPFPTPGLLPGLSSVADECDAMSPDGVALYFTRNPGPGGSVDIHAAVWDGSTFGDVTDLAPLNTPAIDGDPWVSPDQRTMYMASDRVVPGDSDLYVSKR